MTDEPDMRRRPEPPSGRWAAAALIGLLAIAVVYATLANVTDPSPDAAARGVTTTTPASDAGRERFRNPHATTDLPPRGNPSAATTPNRPSGHLP